MPHQFGGTGSATADAYIKSLHGVTAPAGGGDGGGGGTFDDFLKLVEEIGLDAALDAMGLGEDGGDGFAPPAFASTAAGLKLESALAEAFASKEFGRAKELEGLRQAFERSEGAKRFAESLEIEKRREAFERAQRMEELKAERQRLFTELLGRDPVRAALFAMGIGGQILPEGEQFKSLPPLKGGVQQARSTAKALQGLLGGEEGTRSIALGGRGVAGLPSPEKIATLFQLGQRTGAKPVRDLGSARTLLASAFGVGGIKGAGAPGIDPEELLRRIEGVTPTGILQ